jgi:hypothetical protein
MPKVEMVLVYNVHLCFSNVDGRRMCDDRAWLYDTWDEAAAQIKRCVDAHPEADVLLSTETMRSEEYARLPEMSDDVPE